MHTLKIKVMDDCPNRSLVVEYYKKLTHSENNNRINLIVPEDLELPINKVTEIKLGIQCEFVTLKHERWNSGGRDYNNPEHFILVPNNLIASTPLSTLTNGIIDKQYRDQLVVPVRCHCDVDHVTTTVSENPHYRISQAESNLFQIMSFDTEPIRVKLVTELSVPKEHHNCC
jgi:hypothetical protein